jgi:hypothetical protein
VYDPAVARKLNEQIRHLADMLPGAKDPNYKYGFSCECGCGKIVPLSVVEFDRDGAWWKGHEPAQRHAS